VVQAAGLLWGGGVVIGGKWWRGRTGRGRTGVSALPSEEGEETWCKPLACCGGAWWIGGKWRRGRTGRGRTGVSALPWEEGEEEDEDEEEVVAWCEPLACWGGQAAWWIGGKWRRGRAGRGRTGVSALPSEEEEGAWGCVIFGSVLEFVLKIGDGDHVQSRLL
jgi:hypothetical protein